MESERDYFARRGREERLAAEQALTVAARASHVELAERYEHLARAGAGPG